MRIVFFFLHLEHKYSRISYSTASPMAKQRSPHLALLSRLRLKYISTIRIAIQHSSAPKMEPATIRKCLSRNTQPTTTHKGQRPPDNQLVFLVTWKCDNNIQKHRSYINLQIQIAAKMAAAYHSHKNRPLFDYCEEGKRAHCFSFLGLLLLESLSSEK